MTDAPKPREPFYCSFCCKKDSDVLVLIAGPAHLYICDGCTELCACIIAEHRGRARMAAFPKEAIVVPGQGTTEAEAADKR